MNAVSVLYREPKLLKDVQLPPDRNTLIVSVLYREPKLLKESVASQPKYEIVEFQCSTVSRNC